MKGLASNVLAFLLIFGGLFIWPLAKQFLSKTDECIRHLKTYFWVHVVAMSGSLVYVYYSYKTTSLWWYSFIVPYLVGFLSLVLGVLILILGKEKNEFLPESTIQIIQEGLKLPRKN
jgi:thiamine transporter ThiT